MLQGIVAHHKAVMSSLSPTGSLELLLPDTSDGKKLCLWQTEGSSNHLPILVPPSDFTADRLRFRQVRTTICNFFDRVRCVWGRHVSNLGNWSPFNHLTWGQWRISSSCVPISAVAVTSHAARHSALPHSRLVKLFMACQRWQNKITSCSSALGGSNADRYFLALWQKALMLKQQLETRTSNQCLFSYLKFRQRLSVASYSAASPSSKPPSPPPLSSGLEDGSGTWPWGTARSRSLRRSPPRPRADSCVTEQIRQQFYKCGSLKAYGSTWTFSVCFLLRISSWHLPRVKSRF